MIIRARHPKCSQGSSSAAGAPVCRQERPTPPIPHPLVLPAGQVRFDVQNPLAAQAGVTAVLSGVLSLPTGGTSPMIPAELAAPGGDGNPLFVRPGFVTSSISQVDQL